MIEKSFKNIQLLEKALDASWLRNEAISNNIANVNTPNYKREEVRFDAVLSKSISDLTVDAKITHKKHIPFTNSANIAMITKDNSNFRKDGNSVNIDVEMAELAKNSIMYNALSQRVSGFFNRLRMVIRDGR